MYRHDDGRIGIAATERRRADVPYDSQFHSSDRQPVVSRASLLPELAPCDESEHWLRRRLDNIGFFELIDDVNDTICNAGQALGRQLGSVASMDKLATVFLFALAFAA